LQIKNIKTTMIDRTNNILLATTTVVPEQVTLELAPNIILKEEEGGFYQWTDQYDTWDTT